MSYRKFIKESSLSRLLKHNQDRSVGMISAFRYGNSKKENLSLSKKLGSDIRQAGYGYSTVEGTYLETQDDGSVVKQKEKSFFVIGPDSDDGGKFKGVLKKLGKKYDQDSIIYKPFDSENALLIGTTSRSGAYVSKDQEMDIGKFRPQRAGEMYTRMKGQTFTFESVYSVHYPNVYVRGIILRNENIRLEDIDGLFLDELD